MLMALVNRQMQLQTMQQHCSKQQRQQLGL
jgi:hypothetical protein